MLNLLKPNIRKFIIFLVLLAIFFFVPLLQAIEQISACQNPPCEEDKILVSPFYYFFERSGYVLFDSYAVINAIIIGILIIIIYFVSCLVSNKFRK